MKYVRGLRRKHARSAGGRSAISCPGRGRSGAAPSASAPARLPGRSPQRSPRWPACSSAHTKLAPGLRDRGPPVKSLHDYVITRTPGARERCSTSVRALTRGRRSYSLEVSSDDVPLFGRDLGACKRFQALAAARDQLEQLAVLVHAAPLVASRRVEHASSTETSASSISSVDAHRRCRPSARRCAARRRSRAPATGRSQRLIQR